jgi:hypothetical protein
MNIEYLTQVLNNRLNALVLAKDQAFIIGDLNRITEVEAEINSVQDTLSKLNLLTTISTAATAANTTPMTVVQTGIDAINNGALNYSASGDGDLTPLSQYDLSSYATDPVYEQKLTTILSSMGAMNDQATIEQFIKNTSPSSPLTGEMVLSAAQAYSIDTRLLLAMLNLESSFGTTGVGATTFNPGNVGNTGTDTHTFPTWAFGVNAVAEWLNKHRKLSTATSTPNTLN